MWKTVAFIGFSDAYGEGWWNEFSKLAEVRKLKVVANERFNRVDTSVTGQVLKVMAAKPDAILIGGAGNRPAAEVAEGKGLQRASSARRTASPTTTSCASAARIARTPCCPPARCWSRPNCLPTTRSRNRRWSTSANTKRRTARAASMPLAVTPGMPASCLPTQPGGPQKAPAGQPEFRAALRDALEATRNLAGAHGVFNMSANDHLGLDQRARVMVGSTGMAPAARQTGTPINPAAPGAKGRASRGLHFPTLFRDEIMNKKLTWLFWLPCPPPRWPTSTSAFPSPPPARPPRWAFRKNTFALLPTTIGGQKVNYIVLDDATDPTAATKNIKKLISENKVDVVVGLDHNAKSRWR